jgi:linoleoyl-CoA desaturase
MEIGHNVMHGQWDWMNHPVVNSAAWDWDIASTAESWKHSHNYVHHTFTNIRGKDRDLGYEIMRIDPHQPWRPLYLLQPVYNLVLMALFEWAVAVHDMDIKAVRTGEKPLGEAWKDLKGIWRKARKQIAKDYVAFPLLSGVLTASLQAAITSYDLSFDALRPRRRSRSEARRRLDRGWAGTKRRSLRHEGVIPLLDKLVTALVDRRIDHLRPGRRSSSGARTRLERIRDRARRQALSDARILPLLKGRDSFRHTLAANALANVVRNVWSHSIIFCGHFPDQTYTFSEEETAEETRGAAYVRQLVGAANIDGGPLFHVLSGNLGYQVEHHLYPDMPSTRYGEIAPRVREICERYGLPYNTGPLSKQLGMVHRTILRLAFPGGKPRPKPGPYRGEKVRNAGEVEDERLSPPTPQTARGPGS